MKWVGDEAEKRLAPFFPSDEEKPINYFWAHSLTCPHCTAEVILSPNWWLYNRPETRNLHKWCAVKPFVEFKNKEIKFELIKGRKGSGITIDVAGDEYDPNTMVTIARGDGKCLNCGQILEGEYID